MLSGALLRDALISAANHICVHRREINAMNLFPVADGDTGTNLYMAMVSAKWSLLPLDPGCPAYLAARTAAAAALRGAKGNSGILLALLLRGFAKSLGDSESVSPPALAAALEAGAEEARRGIREPVEGTLLTVARESAEAARRFLAVQPETDIPQLWDTVLRAARSSLARTPELLPVLREGGVVDAGGAGLCLIYEAMAHTCSGRGILHEGLEDAAPLEIFGELNMPSGYRDGHYESHYTVMFLLRGVRRAPSGLRERLESLGNNIVLLPDGDTLHCRISTPDPWDALELARACPGFHRFEAAAYPFCRKTAPLPVPETAPHTSANGPLPRPAYCAELILLKDGLLDTEKLDSRLSPLGNSIVIAHTEELIKFHVHTDTPADIFRIGSEFGFPIHAKVDCTGL